MASLRRLASLDITPHTSSSPARCPSRLARHSSLPNLFLGHPDFCIKALRKAASNSLHSHSLWSKLPLCRALFTHSYDELPYFNTSAAVDACGLFARPPDICVGYAANGSQKPSHKEALVAAGKQSSDSENSIVYSEMKEAMCKFEAPARFLKPSASLGSPSSAINTHTHTHTYEASKPTKNPNLSMESSGNGVTGRPLSLRMLKRKLSKGMPQADCNKNSCRPSSRSQKLSRKCPSPMESNHLSKSPVFSDAHDPISRAFASLFYIMKMLQHYVQSQRIRSWPIVFEADQRCYENLVSHACAEMLDSFLWMFQQVFCCTPRLMLLTMVLLADFTLHSMSVHVAFPVAALGEPPTSTGFFRTKKSNVKDVGVSDAHKSYHHLPEEEHKDCTMQRKSMEELLEYGAHSNGSGNRDHAEIRHGDADAEDRPGPWPEAIAEGRAIAPNGANTHGGVGLSPPSSSLWHNVHEKQSELSSSLEDTDCEMPMKLLVAPVRTPTLEADDYPCFDRTDLSYQHEISMDPSNPLLLANYAQFLQLVRHDYGRAEELYKRAVRAEAEVDGDVMGRFASFLWVAKGDLAEAERAFKAATAADPTNAFHAGNYAHFLWNSSAGQA